MKKKEKKRLEKESNSNNTTRSANSLNTNEMLPSIDQSVWGKLPGEVKQLIAEHNRKVRDTRATNNNGSTTQNDTRSTNMATIAEHLNESIEPDQDNDDDQIESSTSIRSILRAASKKKASNQNPLITKQIRTAQEEPPDEDVQEKALIDSGADTCVLGPAFRIVSTTDKVIDIVGAQADMISKDLHIGTGVTLATTENGEKMILRFNQSIINNKNGKSILSMNQMRDYCTDVNEMPKIYGSKQNLDTLDNHTFPLQYKQALTWLEIEYPADEDMEKLPIIEMTSELEWDPDEAGRRPIAPVTKKQPPDIEHFRECLGWKPLKVVEKTIDATTQYASNSLRLPMRQHFKARNRALFVR